VCAINLSSDTSCSLIASFLNYVYVSLVHRGHELSNIHNYNFEGGYNFGFLTVIFHLAREVDLLVGIVTSFINCRGERPLLALQKN
jgi:hypothetical protein